jgi:hypothetical protein
MIDMEMRDIGYIEKLQKLSPTEANREGVNSIQDLN